MQFKDLNVGDLFLDADEDFWKIHEGVHVLTIFRKDKDAPLSENYGSILVGAWGQGGKATFPMTGEVIKIV